MTVKDLWAIFAHPNKQVVVNFSLGYEINEVMQGYIKFEDDAFFVEPLLEFSNKDYTVSAGDVKFKVSTDPLLNQLETLIRFNDPVLATSTKKWADLALNPILSEIIISEEQMVFSELRKTAWDIFERGIKNNRAPYSDYLPITTNLYLRRIHIKDLI